MHFTHFLHRFELLELNGVRPLFDVILTAAESGVFPGEHMFPSAGIGREENLPRNMNFNPIIIVSIVRRDAFRKTLFPLRLLPLRVTATKPNSIMRRFMPERSFNLRKCF